MRLQRGTGARPPLVSGSLLALSATGAAVLAIIVVGHLHPSRLASGTHQRGTRTAQVEQRVARAAAAQSPAVAQAGSLTLGWQASALDLPAAWQVTQGSPNVVVAIVDTGVQSDHAALGGRVLPGYNLIDNTTDANDDNGHGTAAAGIVAATCPRCRILPVKVLAANGTGDWATIAAGISWAADHGAQVINLSVGAPRALDVLDSAISHAVARGAIVVAAAGNDGRDEPFYPAAYPNVVSVAGIDQSGARYPWSDFGPWVTVAAPGCSATTWIAGGYTSDFCGTSTAAPFVAGVAGLARSYQSTLAESAFVAALRSSAATLPDSGTTSSGEIDAYKLLLTLGAPTGPPVGQEPPRVPRAPKVGARLTAFTGTWQRPGTTVVRWQRSADGVSWQTVGSGRTYRPRPADRGFRLRVVVTATNARGSATATSRASARVTAPPRRAKARRKP